MDAYEEKKDLLLEMIAFASVDGQLNKKGYDFLFLIANELNFEKGGFIDLLNQELPNSYDRTASNRIQQFYRLALLFQNEGILYKQDSNLIFQIAICMGLNTDAVKQILKKMKNAPNSIIPEEILLKIFQDETDY